MFDQVVNLRNHLEQLKQMPCNILKLFVYQGRKVTVSFPERLHDSRREVEGGVSLEGNEYT